MANFRERFGNRRVAFGVNGRNGNGKFRNRDERDENHARDDKSDGRSAGAIYIFVIHCAPPSSGSVSGISSGSSATPMASSTRGSRCGYGGWLKNFFRNTHAKNPPMSIMQPICTGSHFHG